MLLKNKFTIPFVKKNIYNLNDISDKDENVIGNGYVNKIYQ